MPKQVIAIDLDDVLAAEKEGIRKFINKTYKTNHTYEDYLHEGPYWGYWESVWKVGDKGKDWYETYENSEAKSLLEAIEGSAEAINALKKRYKLVIVTSRDDRHVQKTHEWLERLFPGAFDGVEFVKVWSKDREVSKAAICKAIGASYLIDDNIEHCQLAAEAGLEAVLFGDYGWNKAKTLPIGVTRITDWPAVVEFFSGRK